MIYDIGQQKEINNNFADLLLIVLKHFDSFVYQDLDYLPYQFIVELPIYSLLAMSMSLNLT